MAFKLTFNRFCVIDPNVVQIFSILWLTFAFRVIMVYESLKGQTGKKTIIEKLAKVCLPFLPPISGHMMIQLDDTSVLFLNTSVHSAVCERCTAITSQMYHHKI